MKFQTRILFLVLLAGSISGCSSSAGIDDFFTFNLNKNITLTAGNAPIWPPVTIPIMISADSADLAAQGTSLNLVKSVKLTKLSFTSSDVNWPFWKVDTLVIFATDSAGTQMVANYIGAVDSLYLSNADIARFIKNPKANFRATFGYRKAPTSAVTYTGQYTLVFTSELLQ